MTDSELIAICTSPAKYLTDTQYKSLGERLRLGTEATRTGIINELAERNKFVKFEKKGKITAIIPTEKGLSTYHNLKKLSVSRVDVTGEWEVWLEDVRCGRLEFKDFESKMRDEIRRVVKEIRDAEMATISGKASNGKWIPKELCSCPKCKEGKVMSGEKGFYCSRYKEGCKYGGYRSICDTRLEDEDVIKLIGGETILVDVKKDKMQWKQKVRFDEDNQKIVFENTELESSYKCPTCGNALTLSGLQYKCNCGFTFWTIVGREKKKLTENQIKSFFTNGTTGVVRGIMGKSKKFDAEIVLKSNKRETEFKFAEPKTKS